MKLCALKSMLLLVLAVLASGMAMSNAHAEAYLSKALGNDWNWVNYPGNLKSPPAGFDNLITVMGTGLFMHYYKPWNASYVGLEGEVKRPDVFKLHKLSANGSKEDLIFSTKQDAQNFCERLIVAAHGLGDDKKSEGHTVFASVWVGLGVPRRAIAVGYRVSYDGEYKGNLTRGKKYWVCPNPWNIAQDPNVPDENELVGVRASGLSNSDLTNSDTDINGLYHVACMDPKMPETNFYFLLGGGWFEYPGNHWFHGDRLDALEDMDATLGAAYCAGRLRT